MSYVVPRAIAALFLLAVTIVLAWTLIVVVGAVSAGGAVILPWWSVYPCMVGLLISGGTLIALLMLALMPHKDISW